MAVKLSVTGLAPHVCAGFSIFEGHEGEDASSLGVYEGAVEQQPLDHVQRWDCSCTDDCCTHAQSLNVGGVKLISRPCAEVGTALVLTIVARTHRA